MPFYLLQTQTEFSPVGVDLIGISNGFPIGGVSVDNPTLSWLNINIIPGGIYVPPLTMGFAVGITPPKDSIDVRFVASPFGGSVSILTGGQIVVTIYESNQDGSASIASSNGTPILTSTPQLTGTNNPLSITTPFTTVVTTVVTTPGSGLRLRLWTAKMSWRPITVATTYEGGVIVCNITDDAAVILGTLTISSGTPSDQLNVPGGIPWTSNNNIVARYFSNGVGNFHLALYTTTEPG